MALRCGTGRPRKDVNDMGGRPSTSKGLCLCGLNSSRSHLVSMGPSPAASELKDGPAVGHGGATRGGGGFGNTDSDPPSCRSTGRHVQNTMETSKALPLEALGRVRSPSISCTWQRPPDTRSITVVRVAAHVMAQLIQNNYGDVDPTRQAPLTIAVYTTVLDARGGRFLYQEHLRSGSRAHGGGRNCSRSC